MEEDLVLQSLEALVADAHAVGEQQLCDVKTRDVAPGNDAAWYRHHLEQVFWRVLLTPALNAAGRFCCIDARNDAADLHMPQTLLSQMLLSQMLLSQTLLFLSSQVCAFM